MDVVPIPLASLLGEQVVVHDQLIVLAVDRQDTPVPRNLSHEVLEAPGVDLGDRGQARLSPFGRSDVGREDLDAGEARLEALMIAGDRGGGSSGGVDRVREICSVRLTSPVSMLA